MNFQVVTAALAMVGGLGLAVGAASAEDTNKAEYSGEADTERLRGSYVVVPTEKLPVWHGGDISRIIYINRCVDGCTIKGGSNDARTNSSSIIRNTAFLSEFAYSDQVFNDTVECVRELYAPFDVEIVTEDPGEVMFHHEAILAGTSAEAGQGQGVGGVAPLAGDCRAINNVISFSFANSLGGNVETLCWTVAQETAHAFGLDHEYHCSDPMTYVPGCSRKYFRDDSFPCGEGGPRQCSCGGSGQNAHRKLLNVFGPSTGGAMAPTANIPLPADGATVEKSDAVFYTSADPRGIRRAELYINGYKWDEKTEPIDTSDPSDILPRNVSSNFAFPGGIPDGVQNIEIRVYNDIEVLSTAEVSVTIGAACTGAETCLDGQSCNSGACAWPAPVGELGDACDRDQDCISDLCPSADGEGRCSTPCNTSITASCEEGFQCISAGNSGVCWPESGGGCCSVGGSGGLPGLELLLFGGLIAIVAVRRRRR